MTFQTAYLEVDDNAKNEDSREEAHEVGKILTVESLTESLDLVSARCQQVEQSDNGTLELSS